jgi:thiamine biosynthesis lipoprotein
MSEKTPATSGPARGPVIRRMAHRAMATMFEILIAEADQAARGAAEAAFVEIDRLERMLSRFMPYSDISRVNVAEPGKAVVVEIETAECLQAARRMWERTDGAFDVTAGSPPRGSPPRGRGEKGAVGMKRIAIDADAMSVTRLDAGVRIDLGGIGKGYALDRAADLLGEWGVRNAMLHGGTSSVRAIGHHPGRDGWQADLRNPSDDQAALGAVMLRDCSFSGSSTAQSRHIIDPRTGKPIDADRAAWALADDATTADALTTALCVMDNEEIRRFAKRNPKLSFILGRRVQGRWRLEAIGPKVLRDDPKN